MFVTFEGIEGSGKSTVIKMIGDYLESRGRTPVITREPGGSPFGLKLREILLDGRIGNLANTAELYLFLADRAQHLEEVIRPALSAGKTVLCDRYSDSTIAYQCYGRGQNSNKVREIIDFVSGQIVPDLTLLLDLPAEAGLARARERNRANGTTIDESRFDLENIDFHAKVRNGFLELSKQEPERIVIIDASRQMEKVFEDCLDALKAFPC